MEKNIYVPTMNWSEPDLVETFSLFKQRMNLYFNVHNIKNDKKLDTVLLSIGLPGLQIYSSWTLSGSENTIENVWYKFEDHLQPQSNQWLARLHLQRTRQRPDESVDSFVSRVRLQAKKCGTRDTREFNDRVIETIISGVKYDIVQRDLLAKPETLSLDEAIGMCRNYEVAADQLKELKDVQRSNTTQPYAVVNAIGAHNQPTPHRKCDYCGRSHPRRATCPALDTTCSTCGRRNHWAVVCRSRSQVPQHHQQQQHQQPRLQRNRTSSQSPKNVHTLREDSYSDEDKPGQIQMNNVHINTVARDEAITNISVQLPDRPLVPASMEVKVDTGAQGNVLPMRAFRVMCPDRMDSKQKITVSALIPCNTTILTAYNGTRIPINGMLTVNCRKNNKTPWSPHLFYVAETPGPIILGLYSCQLLGLVTLHCAMNVKQQNPITNIEQMMKSYPTSFDTLGQFKGDYHIVLKPHSQPVMHATRKCRIQMRNEIKQTVYDMENNGNIRKGTEPTPWVSSLTYPRKSNGELRSTPICGKLPPPAELLMGRKLQTRVPSYTPRIPNHEHVRQSLSDRQYTHAHYHDRHAHKLPPLSTGNLITTQHPTTGRWNRASIVDVCAHPRSYIIETEDGAQYRRNRRHIRHRDPDPIPASEYENPTLPRAPEATCTKSGRISKTTVRYSNWT